MTTKHNQKGNALILILIITTVFSIIFLSLMGQSLNNSKQLNRTEAEFQAVSLAEMGVTYFTSSIRTALEELNNNQDELDIINQIIEDKIVKDYGQVTNENISKIQTEIDNNPSYPLLIAAEWGKRISKSSVIPPNDYIRDIDQQSKSSFQITKVLLTTDEKGLLYNFISKGINENTSVNLATTITIPFNGIKLSIGTTGGDDGGNGGGSSGDLNTEVPTGRDISDPGNLKECPNTDTFSNNECQINTDKEFTSKVDFSNSVIKVNGSLTINKKINKLENTTLFVVKDTTIEGQGNNISNLRLHASEALNFLGNLNGDGLTDSVIEVGGRGNFNNIKLEGSSVYVNGIADFKNINGINNSFIYVNSDTTMDKLDAGVNSTVCIKGNLTISNSVQIGTGSKVYARTSNKSGVITGDTAFLPGGACSREALSNPDLNFILNWDNPSTSAKYDYQY